MTRLLTRHCLAILLGCAPLHAQAAADAVHALQEDKQLAAIRELEIDGGLITLVHRYPASTHTTLDGKAQDLPARTVVKISLNPVDGSDIDVEIWLPDPDEWNSLFLGVGNGGAAGRISPQSLTGPLTAGYAVATTDMGTAPNPESGIGNPEVWKDFGYRATHLMTVAAKKVIKAHFGKGPKLSYFNGGSTGGQQALQEAQRYPEDYDGIIAAIPAHARTPLHAYFLWNDQILRKRPFTREQEANVIAAGKEYMAGREAPPLAGKLISDPRCTPQEIESIIALALKKDPSLTEEHAEALRKLYDGPRHAKTGARIFDGIPIGSSLSASHGHLYLFRWAFGKEKRLEDINFGADIDTYTARLGPYLNAENPDLTAFAHRGGKLLMTSGTEDSIVPFQATLDYYERVIEHFGDIGEVRGFFRYFIIPGMAHGGGPSLTSTPNLLNVLRDWREKGITPDRLDGLRVRDGGKAIDVPVFPYPTKTGWDAETSQFKPVDGERRGVERIADAFLPAAKE